MSLLYQRSQESETFNSEDSADSVYVNSVQIDTKPIPTAKRKITDLNSETIQSIPSIHSHKHLQESAKLKQCHQESAKLKQCHQESAKLKQCDQGNVNIGKEDESTRIDQESVTVSKQNNTSLTTNHTEEDSDDDEDSENMGYIVEGNFVANKSKHAYQYSHAHLESEIMINASVNMVKSIPSNTRADKQRAKRVQERAGRVQERAKEDKMHKVLKQIADEEHLERTLNANSMQEDKRKKRLRLLFDLSELRKVKNQRVNRKLNSAEKKIRQIKRSEAKALNDSLFDDSTDDPTIEQAMQGKDKLHFINAINDHKRELIKILRAIGVKKERPFDTPSINEARKRGDHAEWAEAIRVEMDQMLTDHVHGEEIIGPLPPGANLIGTMWVLKIKRNRSTGAIEQYKARLVALGNQQDESSYDQIKSNTVRGSSVKMIMSIQAITGAFAMVLDVKGAYLKSEVPDNSTEMLYIRFPNGKIYKLQKYLYGLKQAGFKWQENVTGVLIREGYSQSEADPMVFSKWVNGEFITMTLHVDDFYVISTDEAMLKKLHEILSQEYGTVSIKSEDIMAYLGMEVRIEDNGDIFLSQPAYIMSLIELLDLRGKTSRTPMSVDAPHVEGDDERVDQTHYLSLVGALNHLSQYTRPDLLFAVSSVAQKCSAPTVRDLKAVTRIFQYLLFTIELGIRFKKDSEILLTGCVDASHNQYDDARGHYGYSFSLGQGNGSFNAKSSKMKLNTLSSTESEYVAFCEATREAVWLRRLLSDIGFPQHDCTIIYEDNTSTIQLLEGAYNHKASKHVAPKFHYSRDVIQDGEVCVRHLVTTDMEADMLTKSLPFPTHWKFTKKILNGYGEIYDRMLK